MYWALFNIILIFLIIYGSQCQLSFPIKIYHLNKQQADKKYLHKLQRISSNKIPTYHLRPMQSFFALQLKFEGLTYKLSIDTGSSDLLIKGQNTQGNPIQKYCCNQCIQQNQQFSIGYLDGNIEAYQKNMNVQMGEYKFKQSVLVAYKIQNQNYDLQDGIIGLSYQSLSVSNKPNFISTLIKQKIIQSYSYGINLNFHNPTHSFLTFGTYNRQFFQGDLNYFSFQNKNSLMVNINGVSFGEGQIIHITKALFDTGNTCVSIPHRFQEQIISQFEYISQNKDVKSKNKCFFAVEQNNKNFSLLKCKIVDFNTLPNLIIHLGYKKFQISKQFYLQRCMVKQQQPEVYYCQTFIESVKDFQSVILGDSFFTRFYTYFDLEGNRIGIAKNKQSINIQDIKKQMIINQKNWQPLLNDNQFLSILKLVKQIIGKFLKIVFQ